MRWLALGLLTVSTLAAQANEPAQSSKLSLRTSNGLLTNGSTGSAFSLGGLAFQYARFFTPKFAVHGNYRFEFDYGSASVPIHGPDVGARYYFYGLGAPVRRSGEELTVTQRGRFAAYGLAEMGMRFFYIGSNTTDSPDTQLTGTYAIINLGAGADYALTPFLDLNAEFNAGILPFASSDNRIRVQAYSLLLGVSFLW
jgi:hypothetical protein